MPVGWASVLGSDRSVQPLLTRILAAVGAKRHVAFPRIMYQPLGEDRIGVERCDATGPGADVGQRAVNAAARQLPAELT